MATIPESDQLRTRWTGKHEMDGSEIYEYTSDSNELVVRIREDFFDEPDDDFDEDAPSDTPSTSGSPTGTPNAAFTAPPNNSPWVKTTAMKAAANAKATWPSVTGTARRQPTKRCCACWLATTPASGPSGSRPTTGTGPGRLPTSTKHSGCWTTPRC